MFWVVARSRLDKTRTILWICSSVILITYDHSGRWIFHSANARDRLVFFIQVDKFFSIVRKIAWSLLDFVAFTG